MPVYLGNKRVGSCRVNKKKIFGATIDSILGDVDSNGTLKAANEGTDLVFNGVENMVASVLCYKFFGNTHLISVSFPDLLEFRSNALESCFQSCTSLTSASFSLLKTVNANGLQSCFYDCSSLTSTSFPLLKTVNSYGMNYCFGKCTSLTSISFPSLTSVGERGMGSCFDSCSSLTNVEFPSLTSVGERGMEYSFLKCTSLTSISFPSLNSLTYSYGFTVCFQACNSLKNIYFPALKSDSFGSFNNQFNGMLQLVTGCTVHFPSNLESVIGTWSSVTSGFGGTNTTVLFDLPATS